MLKSATYREKKYICGKFLDVYIYPVYPGRPSIQAGRKRHRRPTREVQKKLNQRHATEKFIRLVHANFSEHDLALGLDFARNPETKEQAVKELKKFLRRLRYRYKKMGLELKYLWQLEQSKSGRFHFHVILSGGLDRDEIEKLWGNGYANTKRLQFDKNGLTALSTYMTKTHRREDETRQTYRSYNGSKNLIDPQPQINDSKIRSRKKAAELADMDWNAWHELYPEYEVSDLWPFCSDEYGSVYIFARLRRIDETRLEAKERKKGK